MSNQLAARFANQAVMVSSEKAEWLGECLQAASAELATIKQRMSTEPVVMQDDYWPGEGSWMRMFKPYNVVDGTLIIPIKGVMLHDFPYQLFDWATGYTYIQRAFERGMADGSVQRIAMVVNSGGGDVAGNFDLVDRLFAMRGTKPIHAFVNEHAYSAAFSIASVANKIYLPRTGGVGSVGVLTSHVDMSAMLERIGYKITLIHSGDHKVDGNPYEALKPEVKAKIQKRIDSMRQLFAETVARNLGMEVKAVLDTEAQTYSAAEAIEVGFAHEIRPIDEALAAFTSDPETTEAEEDTMELTAEQEKAVQERISTASASAKADGVKEGAQAERTRIQGILTHEASADRGKLAMHLATTTDMTVEAAAGVLGASAKEVADKPQGTQVQGKDFHEAMNTNNPNLTPDGGADDQGNTAEAEYLAATGFKGDK